MGFGWYKLIGGIREAKYVPYDVDKSNISVFDLRIQRPKRSRKWAYRYSIDTGS